MSLVRLFVPIVFAASAFAQTPAQTEFFEKSVRPVLVKNCQGCHNAKLKSSQFDLSTAAGFVAGGAGGPVIAKEKDRLETSHLLQAVNYDGTLKMPPTGKLKDDDLKVIQQWVAMGAPYPGADQAAVTNKAAAPVEFTPEQKAFWAFQPLRKTAPPQVKNTAWVKSPIDQFVLAKLEEKGIKPAPPASKLALLRRATFDLTGLPPTEQEIQGFLADNSSGAFAKVVDRLLASPRYGERWGRHWLDVARYADSTGNDEDHRYPYSYRYRDYVIQSFNADVPYSQFVREQLAGDLLPADHNGQFNPRGIVATGFLALGAKALAQQDKKKMLYDIYDEQVDVASKAFLGLTMSCARCHNHKFDPILTRDYYSWVGMFASTRDFKDPNAFVSSLLYRPLVPKQEYDKYESQQNKVKSLKFAMEDVKEDQLQVYSHAVAGKLAAYMTAARDPQASREGLDPAILKKWTDFLAGSEAGQQYLDDWKKAPADQVAAVARNFQTATGKSLAEWDGTVNKWREQARKMAAEMSMPPPEKPKFDRKKDPFFADVFFGKGGPFAIAGKDEEAVYSAEARAKLASLKEELAAYEKTAMPEPDMADAVEEGKPVDQKVLLRGDYNNEGEAAPRSVPAILKRYSEPSHYTGSGRLEIADWLVRPDNPLPSRVMVNRIWGWHFGDGFVRTPDNFGKMGDRPSNPELLDYLAAQFIESGWSVKAMQRKIMLSSTYQMASDGDEKSIEADPENRLLTRFDRQRLEVEEIRDGMLAIAGKLDETMGGTMQKGVGTDKENSADRLSLNPENLTRRTVYIPLRRANLPTLLNLFDFGDGTTVNGRRSLTNVAPQALFMMNSDFVAQRAADVFDQVRQLPAQQRLGQVFLKILNRAPAPAEADMALTYIDQFEKRFSAPEAKAWQSYCQILFGSNEFVYVD